MGFGKTQDGTIGSGMSVPGASMWFLDDSKPRKKFDPSSGILLEIRAAEEDACSVPFVLPAVCETGEMDQNPSKSL